MCKVSKYEALVEKSSALANIISLYGESDIDDVHDEHSDGSFTNEMSERQRDNIRTNALIILEGMDTSNDGDEEVRETIWTLDHTGIRMIDMYVVFWLTAGMWSLEMLSALYLSIRFYGFWEDGPLDPFLHPITETPYIFRSLAFIFVDSTTLRGHLFVNAAYVVHRLLMTVFKLSFTKVLFVYVTSVLFYHYSRLIIPPAKRKEEKREVCVYGRTSDGYWDRFMLICTYIARKKDPHLLRHVVSYTISYLLFFCIVS